MNTQEAVAAFLKSRQLRQLTPKTISGYEWALSKLSAEYPEQLPTNPKDIQEIFSTFSNLAPESKKALWQKLKTFCLWLEIEFDLPNLMATIPAPRFRRKLPRTLSEEEITHLLTSMDNERNYAIFALLLDTGIRVGELASLKPENISQNGILVSGKTGDRVVPVSPSVYSLVKRQGDQEGVWRIGDRKPGYLQFNGLQIMIRRQMRRAGFNPPKMGAHTLRHTFGVQYILNGGDVSSLRRIMGHSTVATTMLYVDMSNYHITRQHKKYSPFARLLQENDDFREHHIAMAGVSASL